jgi:hypothetical protein
VDRTTSRLTETIESVDHPRQKILAVFDAQAQMYQQPDFHGCAFIAASTEAPSGGLVEGMPLTSSGLGCASCSPISLSKPVQPILRTSDASSTSSTTERDWQAAWTTTTRQWHPPRAMQSKRS